MKVSVCEIVLRDAEFLFALSQDYGQRLEWDSFLTEAYLIGNASAAGIGVDSFCRNRSGAGMVSRYISYKPPHVAAVTMIKGPWILARFSGSWNFKQSAPGQSMVSFTYNFKTRPVFLRWLLEPMVARLYRKDMRQRLAAFKAWAEASMT